MVKGWAARIAAGLVALAFAAAARGDDAADDLKKLTGKWKVVALTSKGRNAPQDYRDALSFSFAAGTMKIVNAKKAADRESSFALKLETATAPRRFTAERSDGKAGPALRGLYEFTGDQLKLALPSAARTIHPADFAAAAKEGLSIVTLKKDPAN